MVQAGLPPAEPALGSAPRTPETFSGLVYPQGRLRYNTLKDGRHKQLMLSSRVLAHITLTCKVV